MNVNFEAEKPVVHHINKDALKSYTAVLSTTQTAGQIEVHSRALISVSPCRSIHGR